MTLQDVYTLIRTAVTPAQLDEAERVAARHVAAYPAEEPMIAAAMELLYMKRESVRLYGASPCPGTPSRR